MEQSLVFGILGTVALLAVVQIGLAWRLHRSASRIAQFDDRLAHLGDAVALLTETSEMGFRSLASELERQGERRPPARSDAARRTTERVATAARTGRSVEHIAAAEEMSQGEVRLRLHLASAEDGVAAETPTRTRKAAAVNAPGKAPARRRAASRGTLSIAEAGTAAPAAH